MNIQEAINSANISLYKLAKKSNVPYSTVNDLYNHKTAVAKCNASTLFKLSQALNVSMEELLADALIERCNFDLFKSNVCHELKRKGDMKYLLDTIEDKLILKYYSYKWYPECLYTLAMVDYISRTNHIPINKDFDFLRGMKLSKVVYPSSIIALSSALKDNSVKIDAFNNSIYEFKRFNIVESDVRNVI